MLNMQYLEECFQIALERKFPYIAVKISMEGFKEPEVIINPYENFITKLDYYKNVYDEDLNHKFAKGIKITGVTIACDFEEIQEDLC